MLSEPTTDSPRFNIILLETDTDVPATIEILSEAQEVMPVKVKFPEVSNFTASVFIVTYWAVFLLKLPLVYMRVEMR